MEYLVFRLYAPLCSWGEIAVGETRHSAAYPGKSALLGLLGAALGINRNDEARQQALADGYRFAVKVLRTGSLLRDYHTTQAPDSTGKQTYYTRYDELVVGKSRLGTILSTREYRCDALSLVAVVPFAQAPYTLTELRQALLRPKFHLYLGRKSCPPAAPLNPRLIEADGISDAFAKYPIGPLAISRLSMVEIEREKKDNIHSDPAIDWSKTAGKLSREDRQALSIGKEPVRYYWEGDGRDIEPQQILIRHDHPLSRTRWQFTQRMEKLLIISEES